MIHAATDSAFVNRENCFHDPQDVEIGMDHSLQNLGLSYGNMGLYHSWLVCFTAAHCSLNRV